MVFELVVFGQQQVIACQAGHLLMFPGVGTLGLTNALGLKNGTKMDCLALASFTHTHRLTPCKLLRICVGLKGATLHLALYRRAICELLTDGRWRMRAIQAIW